MKQLKPLRLKRNAQPTYTCDIAAGSVHRGGEAVLHRVTASLEDNRYHRGSGVLWIRAYVAKIRLNLRLRRPERKIGRSITMTSEFGRFP